MTDFEQLKALSARVGADPLLVQGAGGNTSIKQGDVMWIKASGTWLKDAAAKDIFVPLDLPRLAAALASDDPRCESCADFIRADLNDGTLRPSIETSVHGLMPHRVVIHVHCVSTIAWAIRESAEESLKGLLASFNWSFIPYARPGLMLARAIRTHMIPGSDVLILGNHGLAVAAGTVAGAGTLLARVTQALHLEPRDFGNPDREALQKTVQGTAYRLPLDAECHSIALNDWGCELGCNNVYYPDHVVFLGTKIPFDLTSGAPAIVRPGEGVLVRKDAKPAIEPMLRCIGDVFRRVPEGVRLQELDAGQIDALLNWDAEKYRQTLSN
jgi:rhamnose utilization protein RhaD (predicted bifunctional aldolase and dehydrogenase)